LSVVGQRIDHYRVTGQVGRGGMGEVYRAVDERLGREVALKLLPLGLALGGERLERRHARLFREAQAASALSHPGIVTLFDVGTWRGRLYLVMELIVGERVSDLVARGVSVAEALRLCADAADALGAAHARGIFHRDIKSDNLMCTPEGRLKVVDFGLAKLRLVPRVEAEVGAPMATPDVETAPDSTDSQSTPLNDASSTDSPGASLHEALAREPSSGAVVAASAALDEGLTREGDVIGTPAYLAPEHGDGAPADAQTEVFALGVVLYELLVGRRPWGGERARDVQKAMLTPPPSPTEAAPERSISAAASAVAMRAISLDRAVRFADMPAFATAARAAISDAHARPSSRLRAYVALGLLLVPAAAGSVVLVARRRRPPVPVAAAAASPSPPVTVRSTRRITFEPGCEEYPSFTPDGKTVIFDSVIQEPGALANDTKLFALDLETGARRRLTHAPDWDFSSSVSPDGRQLAYLHRTSDGLEVRVLPIEGDGAATPTILGKGNGYPAWTADGSVVAGSRGSDVLRWSAPFTGGPPTVLATAPDGGHAYNFATFRDGGIFVAWRPVQEVMQSTLGELGSGGVLVPREQYAFASEPSLFAAPSQDAIYYARHALADADEIVRRPRAGGESVSLPAGISPRAGFAISSDGTRLAYSTCATSALVARLRPGEAPERLGGRGAWDDHESSRLDAQHVLVTSNRTGTEQIFVVELASGQARALVEGSAGGSRASASPDGRRVLYLEARAGLRVVPTSGGPAVTVTRDPADTFAQFTRDGEHVVFERQTAEGPRVYVVSLHGGEPRPLSPPGARMPTVSPTTDRVAYLTPIGKGKGKTLMTVDLDGTHSEILSRDLPPDSYVNPRFSPDGTRVLLIRKRADILEVSLAGGLPRVRWSATSDGIESADYALDGDSIIATLLRWEGDIWLAEGEFR
jgi:serine/threonine protein kinase/Tol biopolymer transport system component